MSKATKSTNTVQVANKNAWEGVECLAILAQRPWADALIALRLGRSFRALRQVREELEQTRESLLKQFGEGRGESFKLVDQAGFNEQWRVLMNASSEVVLHPVSDSVLLTPACETCKTSTPVLTASQYETLVHIGVLVEETTED